MSFKNTWADLAFLHSPTCYSLIPQGCQINVTYPFQILPPQLSTLPHGLCFVWLCTGSGSDEQPGWAAPTLCAHSTAVTIIIRNHIGLSITAVSVIFTRFWHPQSWWSTPEQRFSIRSAEQRDLGASSIQHPSHSLEQLNWEHGWALTMSIF